MFLLLYFKKPLAEAIKAFQNFWNFSLLQTDTQEIQQIQSRLKLYKTAIYIFGCVSSLQIIAFFITPILLPERQLPYLLWLPNGSPSPYYEIVFILEMYALFVLFSMVIGADSMFIAFCGSLGVQFKLLAHKFKNIEYDKGFKELIAYHKYLLR